MDAFRPSGKENMAKVRICLLAPSHPYLPADLERARSGSAP